MAALKELSSTVLWDGQQKVFTHESFMCRCTMKFGMYIPPAVLAGTVSKVPVVYNLGGMASTIEAEISGGQAQKYAAEHNLVIVQVDSSPRNTGIPGEDDPSIFFGHGASFYVDATEPGWKDHYQMFSYVTKEIISVVEANFDFVISGRRGMMGGSMGGHGSLISGLKRPELYETVVAIFPLCNASGPMDPLVVELFAQFYPDILKSKIKKAAYELYLGDNQELWKQYDASECIKSYEGPSRDLLVFMGTDDQLWDTLRVWKLVEAARGQPNINLRVKLLATFHHSSGGEDSVIGTAMKYHASVLNK